MIPIPAHLAASIDKIAGEGKRTAFVVEVFDREIRRREQLEAIRQAAGSWKDQDHPELSQGGDAWVRHMRKQSLARSEKIHEQRKKH